MKASVSFSIVAPATVPSKVDLSDGTASRSSSMKSSAQIERLPGVCTKPLSPTDARVSMSSSCAATVAPAESNAALPTLARDSISSKLVARTSTSLPVDSSPAPPPPTWPAMYASVVLATTAPSTPAPTAAKPASNDPARPLASVLS